jgi:hypothetical protein
VEVCPKFEDEQLSENFFRPKRKIIKSKPVPTPSTPDRPRSAGARPSGAGSGSRLAPDPEACGTGARVRPAGSWPEGCLNPASGPRLTRDSENRAVGSQASTAEPHFELWALEAAAALDVARLVSERLAGSESPGLEMQRLDRYRYGGRIYDLK